MLPLLCAFAVALHVLLKEIASTQMGEGCSTLGDPEAQQEVRVGQPRAREAMAARCDWHAPCRAPLSLPPSRPRRPHRPPRPRPARPQLHEDYGHSAESALVVLIEVVFGMADTRLDCLRQSPVGWLSWVLMVTFAIVMVVLMLNVIIAAMAKVRPRRDATPARSAARMRRTATRTGHAACWRRP